MRVEDLDLQLHSAGRPNGELVVAVRAYDRAADKVVAADTINLNSALSRRRFARALAELLDDADIEAIDKKLLACIPLAETGLPAAAPEEPLPFPVATPSSAPVCGRELLRDLRGYLANYIVLPPKADLAIATWIMAAWSSERWDRFPYLLAWSPTKRCGKSRLLLAIQLICPRPIGAASISAAAIYRLVAKHRPTILIDEAQNLTRQTESAEALRELLCAGAEATATVWRVGGADRDTVEPFAVYAPKVVAHIGEPDDVLADRSIVVRMERRRPGDRIATWRSRTVEGQGQVLAGQLARWSIDHGDHLARLYDVLQPFGLNNDRAAEMWLPLLVVTKAADADLAGELLEAARMMINSDSDAETNGIRLLAAIREEFAGGEFLATQTLLDGLHARSEEPWGSWGRQAKPMTARALSDQLRRFKVFAGHSADGGIRGYRRAAFEMAWERYLPQTVQTVKPSDAT